MTSTDKKLFSLEQLPTGILRINDVLEQIKSTLEVEFSSLNVCGEITNISYSHSGHWYFSLKDTDSLLNVALFKMDAFKNPLIRSLKEGDVVVISGPLSCYTKRGSFQLIARSLKLLGDGSQKEQFEKLKAQLSAEGLFDLARKKTIPSFAKNVGVVTAEASAAWQDVQTVFLRRALMGELILAPALMQGDGAVGRIAQALEQLRVYDEGQRKKNRPGIDIVIITRGGGSREDLMCFNDEGLIRYLADYPLPIISAVGHDVDFTLCDYVSDLRVETPTAAAEKITEAQVQWKMRWQNIQERLPNTSSKIFSTLKLRVQQVHPQKLFLSLGLRTKQWRQRLNRCQESLKQDHRLLPLTTYQLQIDQCSEKLLRALKNQNDSAVKKVDRLHQMLLMLNPSSILKRGYCYTLDENGSVIESAEQAQKRISSHSSKKQLWKIHFYDDEVIVRPKDS